MKKQIVSIALFAGILTASAQTPTTHISDFESVVLTSNHHTVYNDSTGGMGFTNGNAYFPSQWDTSFGGYWSGGWACSSVNDTVNAYPNLYGCAANKGYSNSNKYAVGTTSGNLVFKMTDSLIGKIVSGMYVCNSTYAYKSMKNGDSYEPAFTAHNKDWFKLTIKKYFGGFLANDSSEVYLADFRYTDTTQNYILKNWMWVDLSSLGNTDSLAFFLHSTQNGMYGMNTPAFFCIDNLTLNTYRDTSQHASINQFKIQDLRFNIYPNPATDEINLTISQFDNETINSIVITDMLGKCVHRQIVKLPNCQIDVADLAAGVYYITLNAGDKLLTKKLIKQ